MNPLTQSKNTTILPVLITLTLACFTLSPTARAVTPAPDGGYFQFNTAEGEDALFSNESSVAWYNTAIGYHALYFNTFGIGNTATGYNALALNTTGNANVATGSSALASNTTGNDNTAIGAAALLINRTGSSNVASGVEALRNNSNGSNNTAIGFDAMLKNQGGSNNIALGCRAGRDLSGNDNIAIGNFGFKGEAGTIRIGTAGTQRATYVAGVSGVTVAGGVGVVIDANGQLGTMTSSARYKEKIKPMDKTSEAIFSLQPVMFRYKKAFDPQALPQFGLVAEQVAKVNPDLVARDAEGKPFTVRYDEVNAMLLNEFLKEHRKVEEQAEINQRQEATIARLEATLKAQEAQIQKVSDQINTQTSAPRVVDYN